MVVKTVFYDGENMNEIGKRAYLMEHSHGRCVIGAFDTFLYEDSIWTGHRAVILCILDKSIFLHFVHNGTIFYDKYISSEKRKQIIDDDGSGVPPHKKVR